MWQQVILILACLCLLYVVPNQLDERQAKEKRKRYWYYYTYISTWYMRMRFVPPCIIPEPNLSPPPHISYSTSYLYTRLSTILVYSTCRVKKVSSPYYCCNNKYQVGTYVYTDQVQQQCVRSRREQMRPRSWQNKQPLLLFFFAIIQRTSSLSASDHVGCR